MLSSFPPKATTPEYKSSTFRSFRMVKVSWVFVFAVCFLFLHGSRGRELVATNEEKLASTFKSKTRIEAAAYAFQAADASISTRQIRSRYVMEGPNEGKDLAAGRKTEELKEMMKATSDVSESPDSKLPERSSVGADDKDRPPNTSVFWRVPEKKPSRSEKFPGFDSDYCLPRTHPPTHN